MRLWRHSLPNRDWGHLSRDTTAIEGREKPVARVRPPKPAPRKKGRPRRGEVREPQPETRLQRRVGQAAAEALQELPVHRDVGTKKNAKDYKATWRGYKLHAGVNDCGLPISVALTAASVHDSQVPMPLMKTTRALIDSGIQKAANASCRPAIFINFARGSKVLRLLFAIQSSG
jgi:hypothetical protein